MVQNRVFLSLLVSVSIIRQVDAAFFIKSPFTLRSISFSLSLSFHHAVVSDLFLPIRTDLVNSCSELNMSACSALIEEGLAKAFAKLNGDRNRNRNRVPRRQTQRQTELGGVSVFETVQIEYGGDGDGGVRLSA